MLWVFQFTQLPKEIIFRFMGTIKYPQHVALQLYPLPSESCIICISLTPVIIDKPQPVNGLLLYSFLLSLSLLQAAMEVNNTIREELECTIHQVICNTADRMLLMSDNRYSDIVQETKEATDKKRIGIIS